MEAVRTAGSLLGHFHVGEANRRCPGPGGRFSWAEIGSVLREVDYSGFVVLEPFVVMGGQVGRDVSLWRDLSGGAGPGGQRDPGAGRGGPGQLCQCRAPDAGE